MRQKTIYIASIILIIFFISSFGAQAKTTPTPGLNAMQLVPAPNTGGINSISGKVYDTNGVGIPNAKVTLYYTAWVGEYKAKDPVNLINVTNPQYTSDGRLSPAGLYVYTSIPSGVYVLTAEKGGISVSKVIMVTGGSTMEDITISGYVENKITIAPSTTVAPVPTYAPPVDTGDDQGLDIGNILFQIFYAVLIGIVGLQFVLSVVIIALHVGRHN